MITRVSKSNLDEVIETLSSIFTLVFDVETTGLRAYHDSKMFSLAIADLEGNGYYFNFKSYKGLADEFVLDPSDVKPIMDDYDRLWIAHNAKFDLHFTDQAGIKPFGDYVDTEVLARLYSNNHWGPGAYSLATCCERWLDVRKDDRVKAWMDENGAYTMLPNAEGKDQKHYYFDVVPFELISEYAAQDAIVTGQLYNFLTKNMYETKAVEIERDLTPVLFEMEKTGILIDRKYCEEALAYEKARMAEAQFKCLTITGFQDFTDSAKFLAPLLEKRGFDLPKTEKGNPQITDEALSQKPDDLATAVLELRDAQKRASTYFGNYLFLADKDDRIHPNFRQAGTVTGRMSCNNPNLQNIPNEDAGPYPVRRAFVATPDFVFVSIDYAQMEFRLMLEYAQQMDLIEKIKEGLDPHQATADLTGLDRKAAKTLNFGLLYGMGVAKLAAAIGVEVEEAKRFKYQYFDRLPGVRRFISESARRMEARGYGFSWTGRRFVLEDRKWSYKAANSIIQGGSSEICKVAMVRIRDLLRSNRSRMVLQVHDEILFEVHSSELELVPQLKSLMIEAFDAQAMPMDCSVAVGANFQDMKEIGVG